MELLLVLSDIPDVTQKNLSISAGTRAGGKQNAPPRRLTHTPWTLTSAQPHKQTHHPVTAGQLVWLDPMPSHAVRRPHWVM